MAVVSLLRRLSPAACAPGLSPARHTTSVFTALILALLTPHGSASASGRPSPPDAETFARDQLEEVPGNNLSGWRAAGLTRHRRRFLPAAPFAAKTYGFQDEARVLTAGTTLKREIEGGGAHLYRVAVVAGQFLRVAVEQQGIDVVVALMAPGGERLAEVDSPNGGHGPETLSALCEAAGYYLLEVRSPDKKAAAGFYEIKIDGLREPTPADRASVAAAKTFMEAYKLLSKPPASNRQEAVKKFESVLPVFSALGERNMEVLTRKMVGLAYHSSGELQKALEHYARALPLSRSLGDSRNEAVLLNNIGGVYDILGEPQKALAHYESAYALWQSLGNGGGQGDTLNNIGVIYFNLGELQKALGYYGRALPLRRAAGNPRKEADTLDNLSLIYVSLGEPQTALDYLRQSLELRRAARDVQGEANTLHYIGYTHATTGEFAKALDHYNKALPLRRSAGDRRGEALTLNNIGLAHTSVGEPEKALDYHRQSLQLLRAVGARREEALALNYLGRAQALAGRSEEALENYGRALSLLRELGDRHGEARVRQDVARAESSRGNLAEARKQIEDSISIVEAIRAEVGSPQLRTSFLASRQDAYEFYIDLLMRMHRLDPSAGHDAAALQASERARARSLLEMLSESRVDIRKGVSAPLLERERDLSHLLNAKSERLMRLLGRRDGGEQVAALEKEIGQLETEYQQLQGEIRRSSPRYADITQPRALSLKELQRELLGEDTLLLEYRLGSGRSYLWAVTHDSLRSYEIAGREQIEKAARKLYDLVTARSLGLMGETTPQRRERIRRADVQLPEAAGELSRMVLGPVASVLGSKRLIVVGDGALQYIPFAMLPLPEGGAAEGRLGGSSSAERRSPPPDGGAPPLIVRHEIISLPSVSTLAAQRRELSARKAAPKNVAVLADPVFEPTDGRVKTSARAAGGRERVAVVDRDRVRTLKHLATKSGGSPDGASGHPAIPRLPHTRREAEQILSVARGAPNLKAVDFKATRSTVTGGDLSGYRYIHFATHGYIDAEKPSLSAIVLSLVNERGEPLDGFLRVQEIYNLELPAELVVLSACQTGLGKEIRGEGLVGLTRGFIYAGASRVIVSLWNVSDRGTADLMSRLYRGVIKEGKRPAAALRAAQIAMWEQKQWSSPYYWAAFVQQGEW